MGMLKQGAAICAVIAILLLFVWFAGEGFESRRGKAEQIHAWFQRPDPRYADYKAAFPESNIVEYEKVRMSDRSLAAIESVVK